VTSLGRTVRRALAMGILGLHGCAATTPMDIYVPARCHGAAEPFESYELAFVEVPGFIEPVIESALAQSLAAVGLTRRDSGADVRVVSRFFLIDRSAPRPAGDPFGEPVETGSINRFVAHLEVRLLDSRTGALLWTGSMYRAHAIRGGETFHDQRAELIIRQAFDELFVGLTTPCG
jgi:hypothetical protein